MVHKKKSKKSNSSSAIMTEALVTRYTNIYIGYIIHNLRKSYNEKGANVNFSKKLGCHPSELSSSLLELLLRRDITNIYKKLALKVLNDYKIEIKNLKQQNTAKDYYKYITNLKDPNMIKLINDIKVMVPYFKCKLKEDPYLDRVLDYVIKCGYNTMSYTIDDNTYTYNIEDPTIKYMLLTIFITSSIYKHVDMVNVDGEILTRDTTNE